MFSYNIESIKVNHCRKPKTPVITRKSSDNDIKYYTIG